MFMVHDVMMAQSFLLSSSGDSSHVDFPNKMAQLAAICMIELDQEST